MLSPRNSFRSEAKSTTCDMTLAKSLNIVSSPQTSDTDVPKESINSSDDELEWPDAFSCLLGVREDYCSQRVSMDALETSSEKASIWGNLLLGDMPSTTCTTSASSPNPVEYDLCYDCEEFVDLSEEEGVRRGHELLAILRERSELELDSHYLSTAGDCSSYRASAKSRPDTTAFNNIEGAFSSALENRSAKFTQDRCRQTPPFVEVEERESRAIAGKFQIQDAVHAIAQGVLGQWYSQTQLTTDGFLIKLSAPVHWSRDSFSEKEQLMDQSLACLDANLWPFFQDQGALSLRRTEDLAQLVVAFPAEGHSKDDMCWHFMQTGHCPKRKCRWIHKMPSTYMINVEWDQ